MLSRRIYLSRLRGLAAGLLVMLALSAEAQEPGYLAAVADLPLAPGLVEDVGAGVSFDKPEGRIIEAVASGPVEPSAIVAFYRETLPALGWRPLAGAPRELRWQRGGEQLHVDIVDRTPPVVVRFSIAPN